MKLQVTIDFQAHAKIMHWVRLAGRNEVSGFGKVLKFPNHLHVVDVTLLKQVNTPASTVLDAKDMGRAMYEMKDELGDFNFWWHSHHNMSAYFSGTDYKTMTQFGKNGWLLSTVFNNRGETMTAVYTKEPIEFLSEGFEMVPLPPPIADEVTAKWDELYKNKVTIEPPKPRHGKRWRKGYETWWEENVHVEAEPGKGTAIVGGGV